MTLTKCFDAAFPPAQAPDGCGAVLGYIGRPGPGRLDRDEHPWTLEEWLRFGHIRQFPCWVTDFSKDPRASAADAVHLARALGWNSGRAIVFDTEDLVDRPWCVVFAAEIEGYYFTPVNYGSASVVARNGCGWLWLAKWDGDPQLEDGQGVEAHQYVAGVTVPGGIVDFSVVSDDLLHHGGRGPRHWAVPYNLHNLLT